MSMSDLVNHIENKITKNRTPGDQRPLSHEEQQSLHILEDISRCLFNDSYEHETNNAYEKLAAERSSDEPNPFTEPASVRMVMKDSSEVADDHKTTPGIPRNDSVGELLLNLPRIASLPHFFNI
ncbi:hypothetical protein E3N88_39582 [Mikania micrantha]|uniref:Uncharacterized protein n=1 Tax=Mikania micrantha TaxID=192012 RepID=A0A5N6LY29_9ASTR|nr:hypothetical protein E3N88_39582 [Mikania micrantha]